MNLKDNFTFEYKGKTIQVKKVGEVWCAIHEREGKVPLSDPLEFKYNDTFKTEILIYKRYGSKLLGSYLASDITKPEPPEQKEMEFPLPTDNLVLNEENVMYLAGFKISMLSEGEIIITGPKDYVLNITPMPLDSIIIKLKQ